MSDWKQKIEAQIAETQAAETDIAAGKWRQADHFENLFYSNWNTLKALLDVAVAAEQHTQSIEEGFAATVRPDIARMLLNRALDKLREVGDE